MSSQPNEPVDEELSGLQWLSRHRPEAMEHLLAFFRESGRHLDPKTRFLISVVTKVVNFTPRGLRQYIPRAMREGASRDEILDAILCAYPAAGLTKVVDAVDILRSIADPAADTRQAPTASASDAAGEPAVHVVAQLADLPEGKGQLVEIGDRRIVLFRRGDDVHATSNHCVHMGGELAGGALQGTTVTCPLHGWQFDITDGRCLTREGACIDVFTVEVHHGEVRVHL